jgi:ribosomal protein S18 acetylase RimI-like enzyme
VNPEVVLRAAVAADEPFLEEMLVIAFNFDGTERTPVAELRAKEVPVYVSGWGRVGDHGLVAELDGSVVGAAWARLFDASAETYGHVAPDVPELVCIGILPVAQGKGVGAALFDGLVALLKSEGYRAVSLSVEDGNDKAKAMYERRGFRVVGRNGDSDTMLLDF